MPDIQEGADGADGADSASANEPMIPKWRLDEVLSRMRAREEEIVIKDQLLNQFSARGNQQNQQQQQATAEDYGLDPQTFQAVQKVAHHMVQQQLQQTANPLKHQLATVANNLEETQFLLNHGKDKSKYLEKIKGQRQRHYQETGSYLSVDNAYKLVMFDELTRATANKGATGNQPQTQTANAAQNLEANQGAPDAQQTRQSSGAPAAGKSFSELSLEEQEAYLDGQNNQF